MKPESPSSKRHAALHARLVDILGAERCLTDDLEFYSSDIYGGDKLAACVIRPTSTKSLSRAAAAVTSAGYSIIGRGGGTSYTGGHVPDRENSVVVDTSGLDRIVEINGEDMYVTVEAGVTWQKLHDALKETDVRTPFWGPLSGSVATVGGSCSQNAIIWGSTTFDVSSASVLGLEVVLADGSVLNTGSAAVGAKPFFRPYGPDLTGLFLGDSGALGIKTRVTLRLIRRPKESGFLSYNFDEREKISRALVAITREGLASTCFGMDPVLQYQRIKRASIMQGVRALKGVVSNATNTFTGLKNALRIAIAGRRFIDDNGYSLHIVVDGKDKSAVKRKLALARAICGREGNEITNSLPAMLHGDPFVPMSSAVGPEGERWAPMHGLFALSDGDAAWARIEALLDGFAARLDEHGIIVGFLIAAASPTAFAIEPVFYWPGPRTAWARGALTQAELAKYKDFRDDPAVNRTVVDVREALNELFDELNAAHLQIGKKYHFAEQLEAPAAALLEAIKSAVDPHRLMNPKSLGLD